MSDRGFTLIPVLWILVALSAAVGTSLGVARVGLQTSENRLVLTRAGWARDACIAILQARFARDSSLWLLDSIDLGRGTTCRVRLTDPATRVNINTADSAMLTRLLGMDSLVGALIDWRDADDTPLASGAERDWYLARRRLPPRNGDFASVSELRYVRGFEGAAFDVVSPFLTTRGDGRINPSIAPVEVLAALPLMDPIRARWIVANRQARRGGGDSTEVTPPAVRPRGAGSMREAREFARLTTRESSLLVADVEGWVVGFRPRSTATVVLARAGADLVPLAWEIP